jgi:hypothetical protein
VIDLINIINESKAAVPKQEKEGGVSVLALADDECTEGTNP